jgi:transposase-like protein
MPRRNNRLSDEDRQRIVECFERNEDFLSVADTLGVHRCTAYSVIRRFQQTGHVARAPVAGG